MDVLSDDHEREEIVRTWWKENWKAILLGIVIALGGLVGYRQWQAYRLGQQQEQAYALYQLETKLNLKQTDALPAATEFIAANPNIFGALLSLDLAAARAAAGDFDAALKDADFAVAHGGELVAPAASMTKARLLMQRGDYDAALTALTAQEVPAYAVERAELRGDILGQKGDRAGAREAYLQAVKLSGELKLPLEATLQMKLDSVAVAGDPPAEQLAQERERALLQAGASAAR